MTTITSPQGLSLTFESVQLRAVSVPMTNPIVSNVGQYTHWPFILIDVHTRMHIDKYERPVGVLPDVGHDGIGHGYGDRTQLHAFKGQR